MDNTKISNPLNEPLNWIFSGNDIKKLLSDALLRGLRIRSYYQKKLLSKAIAMVFSKDDCFSIPRLIEQLTDLHYLEEDIESQKNALHLLNRLDPYSEIKEIMISSKNSDNSRAASERTYSPVSSSRTSRIERASCSRSLKSTTFLSLFASV